MEKKYSKTTFDGYTHRFKVQFEVAEHGSHFMDIYSNSGNSLDLVNFIIEKQSEKVLSFQIIHQATKEQDELTSQFIDDILAGI